MRDKSEIARSVIVGMDIPFWDLVKLIMKYSFAAIPAMLIIGAVFTTPFLLVSVLFPEFK